MYLHEAFAKSDKIRQAGFTTEWTIDGDIPAELAIECDWMPVVEQVNFIEASKKWEKFRRRIWAKGYYVFYKSNSLHNSMDTYYTLRNETVFATDFEEYKE